MANLNLEQYQDQFITRREYREDMMPLTEKVSKLSESHLITVSLVENMSKHLAEVAENTKILNGSYKEWLGIKKFTAYVISISCGVSIILFSVDYSGLLRVIGKYLNT